MVLQTEKQRLIWAYKILFLDVLFPLNLRKVIFCDSDQVVRGNMADLWNMDLKVHQLCPAAPAIAAQLLEFVAMTQLCPAAPATGAQLPEFCPTATGTTCKHQLHIVHSCLSLLQ